MKISKFIKLTFLIFFILLSNTHYLYAQAREGLMTPSIQSASSAAYYYMSRPGELTMQVNIWGYVHHPGRYEVPTNTDIIQLLSFAGGPIQDGNLGKIKISRLVATESGRTHKEIYLDLDNLHKIKPDELILTPDDVIYIDRTGWAKFRDVLTVVTSTAMITTAITGVFLTIDRLGE